MSQTFEKNEKAAVALSSVFASLFMTGGKLTVGILTGSLGILSEAAHSALDLVAAMITYFAVKVSDKPADREHHYGHGKVENFSALIEAALLLMTCIWIIKEAVSRLFFHEVAVQITYWSFIIIIVSVIIDFSRSRALSRVAKKYNSQALEADALHFSSDILSSLVVLVGLFFAKYGITIADPLAALAVALIVIAASGRLARRTIDALMDKAPSGLDKLIASEVMNVPGVVGVHKVRLRQTGGRIQGDLHVVMERNVSFVDGHKIASEVEQRLALHSEDIVVHFEPEDDWQEVQKIIGETTKIVQDVMAACADRFREYHDLQVGRGPGGTYVNMHIVLPKGISVQEARECCDLLETKIKQAMAETDIHFRIEPCRCDCKDCSAECTQHNHEQPVIEP